MISQATVKEARRLLAEGKLSQRKIAQHLGISRATIGQIAQGKRPDYEVPEKETTFDKSGLPVRCPTCGGKVFMPCFACGIRAEKNREARYRKNRAALARGELIKTTDARRFVGHG